uniref:Synaptic plasticity regulator PANTS n=1 Tax=Scylla olivacea TaxID=85551 RepID=A0A0P4WPV0_SCYOL
MDTEANLDDLKSLPSFSWLVRPCEYYKEEYSDCSSIKAKFHQYFIHGETRDCSQWKVDYNQCLKFRNQKDMEALSSVIESEKERRQDRLRGHYNNDVWERREAPPEDWNKPLPEYLQKDNQSSYIALKLQEAKQGKEDSSSLCIIS